MTDVPPTRMVSRKLEYAVRFICGVAFGVLLAVGAAMVWHLSWPIAAAIPLATGAAATAYGDRFWHVVLKYPWAWWP